MKKAIVILLLIAFQKNFAQQQIEFVENKGQWDNSISFKGLLNNGSFGLMPNGGYKMLLHNNDDLHKIHDYFHPTNSNDEKPKASSQNELNPLNLRSHMYEARFLNANPTPKIIAEKVITSYNNYIIGNDPSKWASNCKIYQAITYKNIYPNIDVRYYTGNNALKYDIIVHPGGDVKNILIYIDGADDIKISKGNLVIKTSVNDVIEPKPFTYQTKAISRKTIECNYLLKGNIVSFNVGDYDTNETLVIDPQLVFSTFSGSTSDNWGYTATYDGSGNFYAGGIVFATNTLGFPVTPGAFQTNFGGGSASTGEGSPFDVGIMKFSANGSQLLYSTYIGGLGNEQPHSMVVDGSGNLAISGRTTSGNFPTTQPFSGVQGGWDIFILKLNPAGSGLVGSRLIGGSDDDGVNVKSKYIGPPDLNSMNRNYGDDARSEILTDASGNLYLTSCTQSTNFFTTANAFQKTNGSAANPVRKQDAVFIKTSNNLNTITTSTYLGGSGDDAGFVIAINTLNSNLFIGGGTGSSDFPGDKTGVLNSSYQGGICDGFVAILNNDGDQLLKSSYWGTSNIENIYGIQFDRFGFPYIMGTTTGTWPVVNAAFSQTNGKQFIAKLQPNLSNFVYSTVFGSNSPSPNLSPCAFLVDRCENVYVSGWGGTTNTGYLNSGTGGLTVTPDALKNTTDGSDFYFFVLEKNATKQLFGSFFGQTGGPGSGGEHVDGGTSRFDKNGVIYQSLCANCSGGAIFPTTPGAWSTSNGAVTANGGQCNLAAVKIAFNLAGVGAGIQSSIKGLIADTSGCVPLTVSFSDTLAQGKRYFWSYGDGSISDTTTVPKTSHLFNNVGTYSVRLIAIDSSTCNITDTSFLTLRVRNDDATLGLNIQKVGGCNSTTYQFINTSIPPLTKPFKSNSFRISFGDGNSTLMGSLPITHTYAGFGTFNVQMVLIDTNYCNEPDTAFGIVRLIDNVRARFTTPSNGCAPYTPIITNTSIGGVTYTWQDGLGNTQVANTPNFLYTVPGTYTIKMYAFDVASCNQIDSTTITITVNGSPISDFSYSPNPSTINAVNTFTNLSSGGVNYKWFFGDGDSLITNNINASVRHTYLITNAFTPCLVTTNTFGCIDTTCYIVNAEVSPLFDVPNSFTPNGDGNNDFIYVKGFGIAKMDWKIYNRWGNLMFTSSNVKLGWDGKLNGKIQPQDVYQYTLNIEFGDGSKKIKTGDITLLR